MRLFLCGLQCESGTWNRNIARMNVFYRMKCEHKLERGHFAP